MVDLIITGIGGQGTVSLGHLLAETLTETGIPFVAAETHGMSQRGGSVIFHLRIGSYKYSPLIEKQAADCIIAGEPMEALRALEYLKPNGIILTDSHGIMSPVASQMGYDYPELDKIVERIKRYTSKLHLLHATEIARELGSAKIANIVLLGSLMTLDILPLKYHQVMDKIERKWPKFVELNSAALHQGAQHIHGVQSMTS